MSIISVTEPPAVIQGSSTPSSALEEEEMQGPPGPPGSSDSAVLEPFIWTQDPLEAIWTVVHGLGRHASVERIENSFHEPMDAPWRVINLDTIEIDFNGYPMNGFAWVR